MCRGTEDTKIVLIGAEYLSLRLTDPVQCLHPASLASIGTLRLNMLRSIQSDGQ